jgi:hypothetical protein
MIRGTTCQLFDIVTEWKFSMQPWAKVPAKSPHGLENVQCSAFDTEAEGGEADGNAGLLFRYVRRAVLLGSHNGFQQHHVSAFN